MTTAARYLVPLAAAAVATACVTINIYFPAAAAEKAADRIIDEVWQLRERAPDAPEAPTAPATQGETK